MSLKNFQTVEAWTVEAKFHFTLNEATFRITTTHSLLESLSKSKEMSAVTEEFSDDASSLEEPETDAEYYFV